MALPQLLAEALVKIVPGNAEGIARLRELYAYDVVFRDPIQEVHGIGDFIAMNERLVGRMREMEWIIRGSWGDDDDAILEWMMRAKPKLGPSVAVDGITRVKARGGRIYDHRDYWDLGELAASALPGGQKILRAALAPFA